MSDVSYDWLYWKQAKQPFSAETKQYIASLRPLDDAMQLLKLNLRFDSIIGLILSTTFLQVCVEQGLTLFTIASMVQRSWVEDGKKSQLEVLIDKALSEYSVFPTHQQRRRIWLENLTKSLLISTTQYVISTLNNKEKD
jgi:hypothetical protein